jgi:hypothetical protein
MVLAVMQHRKLTKTLISIFVVYYWGFDLVVFLLSPEDILTIIVILLSASADDLGFYFLYWLAPLFGLLWELEVLASGFSLLDTA